MAELAARRGDREAALRFLVREYAEPRDYSADEEEELPSYAWSARVRLGRADPFVPHGLAGRTRDLLLLADILEERGDTWIDRARFAAALEVDPKAQEPSDDDIDAGEGSETSGADDAALMGDESP